MVKKLYKYIKGQWFILLFFVITLWICYGSLLDRGKSLSGVTEETSRVVFGMDTVWDGKYQTYIENEWGNSFPGREFLIRVRNQMLFSLFRLSPNTNVVVGKEKYLFEPGYIYEELQLYPPATDEYIAELEYKLLAFQNELLKNGKEMYIFITPSKAHFCKNEIPVQYELMANEIDIQESSYSKFVKMLNNCGLPYFDSVSYIEENIGKTYSAPVFHKSGTHWTHVWGESAAAEFLQLLNEKSRYELGSIKVSEVESEVPISPDTDLYDSLNLFSRPNEKWYSAMIEKTDEGKDHPNVFFRGASFMGQSLFVLQSENIFSKYVYFENSYYRTDSSEGTIFLSDYMAYDEIDLDTLVGQSDIIILEVNEVSIKYMSFGFIDYLLERPDYFDRVY